MGQKININLKQAAIAAFAMFALAITALVVTAQPAEAQAGACADLGSTQGLAIHNEAGVAAGDYSIYARVKIDSGPATFVLSIDGAGGSVCNEQVSQSGSNGNWVWWKSSQVLDWQGGDMRFQMSGDRDGVGLDCIVLYDEVEGGTFNPSTAADCNPPDAPGDDGGTPGTPGTPGTDGGGELQCPSFRQVSTAITSFFPPKTLPADIAFLDTNSSGELEFREVSTAITTFFLPRCR